MQAHYPATFEREVGCTEAEWLMWLPAAIGSGPWQLTSDAADADADAAAAAEGAGLVAQIDEGSLRLRWHRLPPRRIALVSLPRLAVSFRFEAVSDERRHAFMKRFDLYMQRGGG